MYEHTALRPIGEREPVESRRACTPRAGVACTSSLDVIPPFGRVFPRGLKRHASGQGKVRLGVSVQHPVRRRQALRTLFAAGIVLASGPARAGGSGTACGRRAEYLDEEYLDEHGPSGPRELAAHWVSVTGPSTSLARRLASSPDGSFLAVGARADEAFRVMGPGGATGSVPAKEGGSAVFAESSRALLLALDHAGYSRIVLVNPATGEREDWTELLDLRTVAFGATGLVASHARPARGGASVSLIEGRDRVSELVRTELPAVIAPQGNRVAVIEGARARVVSLDDASSTEWGTLPADATHAAWAGEHLFAACSIGVYALGARRAPRKVFADADPHTLFSLGDKVVCASVRKAALIGDGVRVLVHAPRENITQMSAIPGSDELLVVRGPTVRRLSPRSGNNEVVARGRVGFHLRGAVAYAGGVVTWSARRWVSAEGASCSPVAPPAAFMVD